MKRRKRHSIPGLNATSTADISFMLLIFFLVATSIDADKGLRRQLPPPEDEERQVQADVNRDDVLTVSLAADGSMTANDETVTDEQLRVLATNFISSVGKKHIIAIEAHPDSPYESYFKMQNMLSMAYADARDSKARQQFGKAMAQCTIEQQEAISEQLPWRVAENYHEQEGGEP
jgi:biopolymer transport protein ExbD